MLENNKNVKKIKNKSKQISNINMFNSKNI